MMRALTVVIGLLLALLAVSPAAAKPAFADWAAVVVAADFHAHSGQPTEAFDNARRDVSAQLEKMGFARENLRQFSVRPELYPEKPAKTDGELLRSTLTDLAGKAPGGCLVYLTSHGAPQGVTFDTRILSPSEMADIVDSACPGRPTVVILSACFSGVFVPVLGVSDRMVITAARPDRASFGCGESDRYPYFDDCFLRSAPKVKNFVALGSEVQRCVADKELETGATPPSEPQVFIGPALKPMLPLLSFPSG